MLYVPEHLLLPDVLPTGPSLDQSAPVFLEVPSPTFVLRNKPATLTCRAAHALHLYFRCNGQLMAEREHSQASYVDPQTAIRQLEVRLDVDRRSVEEYFGDYQCECVAWSRHGEKVSDSVIVSAACEYTGRGDHKFESQRGRVFTDYWVFELFSSAP